MLEHPIHISSFRDYIQVSRTGSITYLDQAQANQLFDLIVGKNDSCQDAHAKSLTQNDLKAIAEKRTSITAATTTSTVTQYVRDPYIAQYAKARANGVCQLCNQKAPFLDNAGMPYLESHHIVWLSKGGADSINNTVALCPNCHKKMHIVNDNADVVYLLNKVK